MGYGGRAGAAEHWGCFGDGGIGGVLRQDVLGLDHVFVQAKRSTHDGEAAFRFVRLSRSVAS